MDRETGRTNETLRQTVAGGKRTISHEEAKQKAIAEFEKYRKMEMLQYESDYDRAIRELIDKEKNKI